MPEQKATTAGKLHTLQQLRQLKWALSYTSPSQAWIA
jgi:hypothetical protein